MTTTIRQRVTNVNGATLHLTEAGEPGAPLILLSHGFPECAYSWRHQMEPLAAAGYHVIAPDQRGYGHSSAPHDVSFYGINNLAGDLCALIDEQGHDQAIFVGHDWGAIIVWETSRLFPERVKAVVGVSVGFTQWPMRPTELFKAAFGDRFFYMSYFQNIGPPEKELDANPRDSMSKVLWVASKDGFPGVPDELPPMEGTGFLSLTNTPPPLPWRWLTAADLDYYTAQYTQSGFFGPVSYYRNLDANYEITKDLSPDRISMPSFFISGADDVVNLMNPTAIDTMAATLPDFRGGVLIPDAGHWTQQEQPEVFNATLLNFLQTI